MDCSRAQQSQASDEVDKTTAVVEKQQHSQSKQVSKDVREGKKTGAWKCTKNHLSRYLVTDAYTPTHTVCFDHFVLVPSHFLHMVRSFVNSSK